MQEHDFPTKLNSLTQELPSGLKSPEVRIVFECKLQTPLKMLSKDRASSLGCQGSRRWSQACLPSCATSLRAWLPCVHKGVLLTVKARRKKMGERAEADVHVKALPNSSHSYPVGQNWSHHDFLPIKASEEQDEERGMNRWGGHRLPNLHLQPQEALCNWLWWFG